MRPKTQTLAIASINKLLTSQIEFYQIGLLKYSWIYGGGGGATVSQSRKN